MRREAAFGVFCLTTVYPTTATGAHGNSGGKMTGKDVFPSGKGQKRLKMSGNRYSGFLWDFDAAGSSPVTPTNFADSSAHESRKVGILCGFLKKETAVLIWQIY